MNAECNDLRLAIDRIRARGEKRGVLPRKAEPTTQEELPSVRPIAPQRKRPTSVPTTTVHLGRLPLFMPVRRPRVAPIRSHETGWGKVSINGRLGQAHANLIECIWYCSSDIAQAPDGRIGAIIDPYRVRKEMAGGSYGEYSYSTLWTLLHDLMAAVVDVSIPARDIRALGHLIDSVTESPTTVRAPGGGKRSLWRVELGVVGSHLLCKDLPMRRLPLSRANLHHALSMAVARHVLTHRASPPTGWWVDRLLVAVGVGEDSTSRRNRRRELHRDSGALRAIGIEIDGHRVHLRKSAPV